MDWNSNVRKPYVSRPVDTSNFCSLYNSSFDHFPGLEMKQQTMVPMIMNKNNLEVDPKKTWLSNEQLELLENSFHEEIKLEPDRKMKLAKEPTAAAAPDRHLVPEPEDSLEGNRLEHLYDALKHDYDAVSRDKHKLQQEEQEEVRGKKEND